MFDLDSTIKGLKNGSIKDIELFSHITDEQLLYKENDKCLLDYIFDKTIIVNPDILFKLKNNIRVIEYAILYNQPFIIKDNRLDYNVTKETLYQELSWGITLLEYLFICNMVDYEVVNKCDGELIISMIIKYNKLDYFKYLNENILFSKYKEYDYFIEYLFKTNYEELTRIISGIRYYNAIYDLCIKYNRKVIDTNEGLLFTRDENGIYYFDKLLYKGLITDYLVRNVQDEVNKKHMIKKLKERRLYNFLIHFPEELLEKVDEKNTYLDLLLDEYDKYKDTYLAHINYFYVSTDALAEYYIKCAKKDLLSFLPVLGECSLLMYDKKNKNLIYYLLKKDKKTTINKILKDDIKSIPSIATILKMNNINVNHIDVPVDDIPFGTKNRNKYLEIKLPEYLEKKLNEIQELFEKDKKSSKEAILTLISSYKHLYTLNYPYLNRELDLIIETKKNNDNYFIISKNTIHPHYSCGVITINDNIIGVFNHEMSHAIHDINTYYRTPNEYYMVINKNKYNEEYIKRIKTFAERYQKMKKEIHNEALRIYDELYGDYFTKEIIDEMNKKVKSLKERELYKLDKMFKNKEKLKNAIDELYDIEIYKFLDEHKRKTVFNIEEALEREKAVHLGQISDIIDAIYNGRLRDNLFLNEKDSIKLLFGHGIKYYERESVAFVEMLADYITILKSEQSELSIKYLRYLVGDEIVDMLDNFYKNDILELKKYKC